MRRRRELLASSMSYNGGDSNEGPIDINNYLTIEALENGLTVHIEGYTGNYDYCVDGDGNWKKKTINSPTESINAGQTISLRANTATRIITKISCYGRKYNLIGNCMSIIFGDNAANSSSLIGHNDAFNDLFYREQGLISVSSSFLPATNLAYNCYAYMFKDCTSLTTAPELPATTLATGCYYQMFKGCTNLTTAPELPATTLTDGCYDGMFYGCSNLNYIKMLATDISAEDCLLYWVEDVAPTGTFVKNPAMIALPTGYHGIPEGWTVVNDGEESGGELLEFTVKDTATNIVYGPYQFEEGMTGQDFFDSEYLVSPLTYGTGGIYIHINGFNYGYFVAFNEVIQPIQYTINSGGGSGEPL